MLNAAIVGLGAYAERLVSPVQGKSGKIAFVAGATRDAAKGKAFADRHGFALAADYQALLARPEVNAVVLATPHSLHAAQVQQAARAGKHVFVEKPFTLTRASADESCAVCRQHGVTLAVGFNTRFYPAVAELHRLVAAGAVGKVLHVEGQISGPPGNASAQLAGHWRSTRAEQPAGGMTGKGIHLVDLMLWMCGQIDSVYARSERRVIPLDMDDVTSMLFRFRSGASGYLATLLSTAPYWRLQILGSEGWAEVREQNVLTVQRLNEPVRTRTYDDCDTRRAELDAFADAVAGVSPYPVTAEEAIAGSAVLEAIDRSARLGQEVRVA